MFSYLPSILSPPVSRFEAKYSSCPLQNQPWNKPWKEIGAIRWYYCVWNVVLSNVPSIVLLLAAPFWFWFLSAKERRIDGREVKSIEPINGNRLWCGYNVDHPTSRPQPPYWHFYRSRIEHAIDAGASQHLDGSYSFWKEEQDVFSLFSSTSCSRYPGYSGVTHIRHLSSFNRERAPWGFKPWKKLNIFGKIR